MHCTPRPRRPFNRILVAQHVTMPQMWISCLVAVQVGEEANATAGWSCARQAQPDMVHFPELLPSTPCSTALAACCACPFAARGRDIRVYSSTQDGLCRRGMVHHLVRCHLAEQLLLHCIERTQSASSIGIAAHFSCLPTCP